MRSGKHRKSITLCASAAFFKDMAPIEKQLKSMGFDVKLPNAISDAMPFKEEVLGMQPVFLYGGVGKVAEKRRRKSER